MRAKKIGKIVFIMDERLSREKANILTRTLNAIRVIADVSVLSGGITEEELLKNLEEGTPALVLAPWYRYLAWSRVEAFYGLTRSSGPTFAGYFCDTVKPYEIGETPDYMRTIIFDFAQLPTDQTMRLIQALSQDLKRSGLLPLLDRDTSVYCENWYGGLGLGLKMDSVMGLPEITTTEWARRGNAIRICMNALWSLIYEEGPGKNEFHQTITANSPKAYFQVAADRKFLMFRLCFSMPNWSPKDMLHSFWPGRGSPSSPGQLLQRYSDFLRVHRIVENNDIEIVAGLSSTAPSEQPGDQIRTLWIEPITANFVSEIPYEVPNPGSKHLKLLPTVSLADPKLRSEHGTQARERFIVDAAVKIRDLKKLLAEREELIRELRSGGVGIAVPLPPPDVDSLLEAFQERFFEARYQIRQFEIQITQMEEKGTTPDEVETLRQKMQALAQREQSWIKSLVSTIEGIRLARKA